MIKVSGDWLTAKPTQDVARMLTEAGYQALFVGGCVRNALLGVPVSDIDMSTDARPETVVQIAKSNGLKAIPTGIDHGTITVVSSSIAHEITTFRKDIATDGRHAEVAFSTDIKHDAMRRDFTMNALYADANGSVLDPVNGLPDLQRRCVRFVGNASERIAEDYLRILRFFRFHAWYGDAQEGIDADGLSACAEGIDGLEGLSRERVGAEMIKLLSARDPAASVAAMSLSGVLNRVMEGADPKALAPLVHFEKGIAPDWRRRAIVLGCQDLSDAWRLSKKDRHHLNALRAAVSAMSTLSEVAYREGPAEAKNLAFARAALFETPLADGFETEIIKGATAQFPVKAVDLDGFQGRVLGQKLKALEAKWIASNFELSKDELLAL
jgi:poly(A) polymerase